MNLRFILPLLISLALIVAAIVIPTLVAHGLGSTTLFDVGDDAPVCDDAPECDDDNDDDEDDGDDDDDDARECRGGMESITLEFTSASISVGDTVEIIVKTGPKRVLDFVEIMLGDKLTIDSAQPGKRFRTGDLKLTVTDSTEATLTKNLKVHVSCSDDPFIGKTYTKDDVTFTLVAFTSVMGGPVGPTPRPTPTPTPVPTPTPTSTPVPTPTLTPTATATAVPTHTICDIYAYAEPKPPADPDTHTYARCDAHTHTHTICDIYTYAEPKPPADPDTHTYARCNAHTHVHCEGCAHIHTDTSLTRNNAHRSYDFVH